MIWVLFTVVAVLLVGVFAGLLAGRIGYDPMSEAVTSQPDTGLADDFTARSVSDVHFDTALRGYRMDQVDHVLDALQERLAEQEREIATLRDGDLAPREADVSSRGTGASQRDDAAYRDASQREDVPHREHDA
ncbi:DivIVA domain-containing protein [Phycicoccus sp. SLBN-51]|uniref:DivIVA domain-containing protein n=1 Tax=Phycicoccus sp. SLBN-51 TaxID=2768447 RepID=UPI001166D94D|nr:DivIVA domain-containing protein [Phycicoccus sp. SLBN-51]TQJ49697.1 DivIVA domain-containing protein [Phycicoccus sp. SLBN-51]